MKKYHYSCDKSYILYDGRPRYYMIYRYCTSGRYSTVDMHTFRTALEMGPVKPDQYGAPDRVKLHASHSAMGGRPLGCGVQERGADR